METEKRGVSLLCICRIRTKMIQLRVHACSYILTVHPVHRVCFLLEAHFCLQKICMHTVNVCVCVSTVAQHSGGWGSSSICDVAWMKRKLGHDTALLFCYCCLALTLDGDSLRHTHAYTFVHTRRNLKVV